MKKLIFDLVDEVWDAGDYLVVKNKGIEERIRFSNIKNVSSSSFTNPERITLSLREPSRLGLEITFSPPIRFLHLSRSPIASELIDKVEHARRT